ncbi:MAG: LTA synthase family protein [Clostridia bacterium]|nr:LTA synthase family protein [Clostridia bacterium]
MQRIFKQRKYIILAIAVILIFLGVIGFNIEKNQYKSKDLTIDEILYNATSIKEFEIRDGRFLSISEDPWIEYPLNSGEKINTITIDVNYLSDNYSGSEVFVFHNDESFTRYFDTLKLGKNVIWVKDKEISSLRFDLLVGEKQEIGINGISFNNGESYGIYLKEKIRSFYGYLYIIPIVICYFIIPVAIISIFILLAVNRKSLRSNRKKALLWGGLSIGSVVLLYLISLIFSIKILYKDRNMSFSELIKGANEFEIDESNNLITSTDYDSWIYVPYNGGNGVRTITINLHSWQGSEDDADSELYIFYNAGRGEFEVLDYPLNVGENTIYIPERIRKIESFRFDFTYSSGVSIGLGNIEFNRPDVLRNAVINEISGYISKVFIWLALIILSGISLILGRKKSFCVNSFIGKMGDFIVAFLLFISFILCFSVPMVAIIPVVLIGFYLGKYSSIEKYDKKYDSLLRVILILSSLLAYLFIPKLGILHLLNSVEGGQGVNLFISLLCVYVFVNIGAILYGDNGKKECNYKVGTGKIFSLLCDVFIVFVMTAALEVMVKVFFQNITVAGAFGTFINSKTIWLNLMLWGVIYFFVRNLLGRILGSIAAFALYIFFFIGNLVKLKYHDTIFLPMDFLQIGDFLGIVFRYIPEFLFWFIIFIIVLIILFLIFKYRKYFVKYKPNLYVSAVCLYMIISLSNLIDKNAFIDMGFDVKQTWLIAKDCIKEEGAITYSYIKFRELLKIFPKPDENYNEDYMADMKNEFDNINSGEISDVKPNVILVMEESMFDVCTVPDVNFSHKLDENILKYEKAKTISPKYGGGTASVEFEALTGFSNFFFLDNIVPYVTYWNNENAYIPCIAHEFANNGYATTAIHPNDGGYYNRNIIYSAMGFDKFVDKNDLDYSLENVADDGWFKDVPLADVIKDEMEKTDEPQFIFTVTVENHMLYESKYNETEVKLSSDKLKGNELHQLEQYSQGVYNADKFIEKMIDIVNNAERPTILYIWGDHLPALTAFNTLGFIDDKYNKYSTPLVAYSNYKNIEIGQEYITPNQLAPQILRDAEISYSSYFDFIYSLREKYPVIQKEFGIDPNDELIKKYQEVQYDLLFGKKYLLSDK